MKLILQGMRRSGTTIVYDALDQDPDISLWYEPLAAAKKPAIGGGSGVRDIDVFKRLRDARSVFLAENEVEDSAILNHGAPRNPDLEFSREFPPVVEDYLRFLMNTSSPAIAKFTRLYTKVPEIYRLFPDAGFIHLVRDPRAVAISYLFGKNRRNEKHASPLEVFFTRQTERSAWSSYAISELVRNEYIHENLPEPTDLERVLLIWRFTFERVRKDAMSTYGDKMLMLRHEDFCADPINELERLYSMIGSTVPENVQKWASKNVRLPGPIHAEGDPRWIEAFDRMGMLQTVADAGYQIDYLNNAVSSDSKKHPILKWLKNSMKKKDNKAGG